MDNDMEMYLEKILKKTNPEKYIEILEQDREDFAKEIVELNQKIDKAIECIKEKLNINSGYVDYDFGTELLRQELLDILQGSDKE